MPRGCRGKLTSVISDTYNSIILDAGDYVFKVPKHNYYPHEIISSIIMGSCEDIIHPVKVLKLHEDIRSELERTTRTRVSSVAIKYPKAKYDLERVINMEIDESDVYQLCMNVVNVITNIHCRGIVHGDVSPKNFLFMDGKFVGSDLGDCYPLCSSRAVYTPGYKAPEVINGQCRTLASTSTDIWALGATMYSIITGGIVEDAEEDLQEELDRYLPEHPHLAKMVVKCLDTDTSSRLLDASIIQGTTMCKYSVPLLDPEKVTDIIKTYIPSGNEDIVDKMLGESLNSENPNILTGRERDKAVAVYNTLLNKRSSIGNKIAESYK